MKPARACVSDLLAGTGTWMVRSSRTLTSTGTIGLSSLPLRAIAALALGLDRYLRVGAVAQEAGVVGARTTRAVSEGTGIDGLLHALEDFSDLSLDGVGDHRCYLLIFQSFRRSTWMASLN